MHLFQYWPAEIDHLKRRKQKSEVTGFLDHFTAAYSGAALVFLDTDLRYLFQKVAQFVFEQEFASKQDYRMTAKTFTHMMLNVGAFLSDEVIEEFEKDSINYSRLSGSARKLQTGMGKTDFELDAYKDEIKISKGGRNELFRKTRADCGREQRNGAAGRQSAPQSRGLCDDRRQPEGEA